MRFLSVDVIPSEARDLACTKGGDATRQILRPSGLRMTSVWGDGEDARPSIERVGAVPVALLDA